MLKLSHRNEGVIPHYVRQVNILAFQSGLSVKNETHTLGLNCVYGFILFFVQFKMYFKEELQ